MLKHRKFFPQNLPTSCESAGDPSGQLVGSAYLQFQHHQSRKITNELLKKNPRLSEVVFQFFRTFHHQLKYRHPSWNARSLYTKPLYTSRVRCYTSIDSPASFSQHTQQRRVNTCESRIARAPCSAIQGPASGPALCRVKIPKQLRLLCVCVCVCVCERRE